MNFNGFNLRQLSEQIMFKYGNEICYKNRKREVWFLGSTSGTVMETIQGKTIAAYLGVHINFIRSAEFTKIVCSMR